MKNLYCIFLVVMLLPLCVAGQINHVPNPSFEDTLGCPSNVAQIDTKCSYWSKYTSATPDYHNTCGSGNIGVPNNFAGFQYPKHGNAYCGFLAYYAGTPHYEYITAQISPLNIGWTYEVSMYVSLANNSRYATDNIGVYFFDSGLQTISTVNILSFQPQIYYSNYGVITDTVNWVRLTKTFTADSAYDHIVIGPYNNSSNTFNLDTVANSGYTTAYYYIDSVVVKLFDTFRIAQVDTLLCANDSVDVNIQVSRQFYTNNTFTIQLSDENGSFATPLNIGSLNAVTANTIPCLLPSNLKNGTSYKMRLITSAPVDTSDVYSKVIAIANRDSISYNVNSNSPVCKDATIAFSANSNFSPTYYVWSGPNGFNSTSANPFINGASSVHNGNYYATLKFYGCEVTDTLPVAVQPIPVKPVANSNTPICAGESLQLTVSNSNNISYVWSGPASFTSSTQNPTISNTTTAMSGDYIVTADSNGCGRKDTVTVLVKPLPTAITTSSNTPLCAGDTLKIFSTASSSGVTYTWNGPASYNANTQNSSRPNTTAAMTGWYKMSVDLNGCTIADSTFATVHPIPATPTISFNSPLCLGETLNLSASTVGGATYTWTGPGNFTSGTQNAVRNNMQFGDTGTYKLSVGMNGCSSPETIAKVYINPIPFVVIFTTPADSICQGDPVVFTALPNNHGGTPNYQWKVNAQNAGTGTVFNTSSLNDGDVVLCEMTENTKCSVPYKDESNDIQMTVLPWLAPSVSITANPTHPLDEYEYVTFTAVTTNAGKNPKYQWKRNGQDIVGATGNIWSANTLNDNDSISVEIISDYKCPQPTTAKSNWIKVQMTGVDDINTSGELTLYPNPNNGKFVVEAPLYLSPKGRGLVNIEVVNTFGQVVYSNNVTAANGTLRKEIDLQSVAAGVYLLRLKDSNGQSATMRFRVE